MADRLPWFPFWVDDFLLDERVRAMSLAEVGAYLKLLCWQWREGSIPSDLARLKPGLNLATAELADDQLFNILGSCFGLRDVGKPERLENSRLSKIAQEQRLKSSSLAKAGKKGGLSRAQARLKQSELESEKEIETETKDKDSPRDKRAVTDEPEGFALFWATYPRRAGARPRAPTLTRYRGLVTHGVAREAIQAGVERYAAYCRATGKEGTEYVKQPANFLSTVGMLWTEPWTVPAGGNGKLTQLDKNEQVLATYLEAHRGD